jgi:hypothetical protein
VEILTSYATAVKLNWKLAALRCLQSIVLTAKMMRTEIVTSGGFPSQAFRNGGMLHSTEMI